MTKIALEIDGHPVETESGNTVLQAALDAGIYIPHLCSHPNLEPVGACRLCLVEIAGIPGTPSSCNTFAADLMVVKTKSEKLGKLQDIALRLLLINHPSDCTTCPKYLNCELQSLKQYLRINENTNYKRRPRTFSLNTSNPLLVHDFGRCVMCGRCIRACNELRGIGALTYSNHGGNTCIGTVSDGSLVEAGCKFCGACAEVCPTGAIRDQDDVLKSGKGRKASLVPCRYTCPAEIDVPRYVRLIRQGNYSAAFAVIREKTPFPLTLGYVCNHECEAVCRRGAINQSVDIRRLKRFAAEQGVWTTGQHLKLPPTGKKVAVTGSGPAGLTAAYYLNSRGHEVTVFEALPLTGGMLRFGIPEFRLPANVLDAEIRIIEASGVQIRTNTAVEIPGNLLTEGYDAVLVSTGAHYGHKLNIPGIDLNRVLVGVSFLKDVRSSKKIDIGKNVLVIGGGNVAIDCARTALRLEATKVSLACLEPADKMLADVEEIDCARQEGITFYNSKSFNAILGENGIVTGVECFDVDSFEFNEDGQIRVEYVKNSMHIISADTIIFAVGQRPDISEKSELILARGNVIQVDKYSFSTDKDGIFACGDAITGTKSVINAIASGRKAASSIDKYLGGTGIIDSPSSQTEFEHRFGPSDNFAALVREEIPCVGERAKLNFTCEPGYSEEAAIRESSRCLQCDARLKFNLVKYWADYPR